MATRDAAAVPLIVDCDPGHDDAMALLLAVASPKVDLLAVTTTFGNCAVEDATRNAVRILTLAGVRDVPVAAGAQGPWQGPAELGNYVHGVSGLDGPDMPDPGFSAVDVSAVELMVDVLQKAVRPVTISATGPITNVARLLDQHGDLKPRIAEIVFMGGSTERGNHTPAAEFNAYADPESLQLVLNSGVPLRMVGLNLTHQALATEQVVDRLRAMNHAIGRTAAAWMGFFGSSYRAIWEFDAPPVHDPCTVAWVIDPELVTARDFFVAVETQGEWTRGATVVDIYNRYQRTPNVAVGLRLDVLAYWDLVLSHIDRLGVAP